MMTLAALMMYSYYSDGLCPAEWTSSEGLKFERFRNANTQSQQHIQQTRTVASATFAFVLYGIYFLRQAVTQAQNSDKNLNAKIITEM